MDWNVENRREFISKIRWASKIVHEWNDHLEIFSQVKENSRQNLLLRTDILQKTVVGCPWPELWKTTIGLIAAHFLVHFLAVDLHDCNVKRPENFLVFTFYGGNVVHVLVHFSTAAQFFQLCCKICICSVILGQIGSFWKLQWLHYYLPDWLT